MKREVGRAQGWVGWKGDDETLHRKGEKERERENEREQAREIRRGKGGLRKAIFEYKD